MATPVFTATHLKVSHYTIRFVFGANLLHLFHSEVGDFTNNTWPDEVKYSVIAS